MAKYLFKLLMLVVLIIVLINFGDAKKKKKNNKAMVLRQKETNAVNFIRLAVMRLIYGLATRLGFGEQISEALNGAFVPPGADYDDYGGGGFDLLDRDDEYDY